MLIDSSIHFPRNPGWCPCETTEQAAAKSEVPSIENMSSSRRFNTLLVAFSYLMNDD